MGELSYEAARDELVAATEAKGFQAEPAAARATSPTPKRGPSCPVHCCHPLTLEAMAAQGLGLCRRHEGQLSPVTRSALAKAFEGRDAEFAGQVLKEAVSELRRHPSWTRFAVFSGDTVTRHPEFEAAVVHWASLRAEGGKPKLFGGKVGAVVEEGRVQACTPHRVELEGETLGRADTLVEAVRRVRLSKTERPSMVDGVEVWPRGAAPEFVGLWTGERLTWGAAVKLAAREEALRGRP